MSTSDGFSFYLCLNMDRLMQSLMCLEKEFQGKGAARGCS